MGETTHISWADHTFNAWVGCTRISNGLLGACEGCYAANLMDTRLGRVRFGGPGVGVGTRERTSETNWRQPLKWDRAAAKAGNRPFVFCSSLADMFDNEVPAEWRADLFDLIRATPNLTWLLLTKRPSNIVSLFEESLIQPEEGEWYLPDVWPCNAAIGATVVTQDEADRDIPKLLAAKAALMPAFAFLSIEPMMGPIDLTRVYLGSGAGEPGTGLRKVRLNLDALRGAKSVGWRGLDWVITGGETDQGAHRARPSHPDWFRKVRDDCAAAGVAYHHKQNGEWVAYGQHNGRPHENLGLPAEPREDCELLGEPMFKVGKRAAGRTLDGVIHDARPETTP